MSGISAVFVDSDTLTISGTNYTSECHYARRLLCDCDTDGDKGVTILNSSWSDPLTTVNMLASDSDSLTSNLISFKFGPGVTTDEYGSVSPRGIDHDKLTNYSSDEHYTEASIDKYTEAEVDTISGSLQTNIDAKGDMNDLVDDITPQLGGDLDLNSHCINYGAILTVNSTYEGNIITVTVDDASAVFGNVLYQAADFHYERCDADADSTMPCRALALESGSGSKKVLLKGQICNTSWDWSAGTVWTSLTTGGITQTLASGTGDQVQEIGFALSADTLFFDPISIIAEVE